MNQRTKVAISAVTLHLSIGSVYAWSVFSKPLQDFTNWSLKEINFTFGLAIFFLGMSAAFLGHFAERQGPSKSAKIAAVLFGSGLILGGVSVHFHQLWGLYLGYGVLGGMGLGLGYVAPVSTLVKWFPDKPGLASGLAIMGFGFAAAIASPVMRWLIQANGITLTFAILGVSYGLIMFLASFELKTPPNDSKVDKFAKSKNAPISELSLKESVRSHRFYLMWIMFFLNITCGIALLSVASPITQELLELTPMQAAAIVGFLGIFNGAGRLVWATVSDWLGRPNTFIAFFAFQMVALYFMANTKTAIVFEILLFLVISCYGGGFSTVPAFIRDIFGTKELGIKYGYMLTAWAMAGLVGSTLMAKVRESTGSYESALLFFVGLFIVNLLLSIIMKISFNKAKKSSELIHSSTSTSEAVTA